MTSTENLNQIFPKGEKAPDNYFTGTAWIKVLVDEAPHHCIVSNVIFEPRARTHWHTHPAGQILLIAEGICCYQEKGLPVQKFHKGQVIKIPPDVIHWHGASEDASMTHIAITEKTEKGTVVWLEKVTDGENNNAN